MPMMWLLNEGCKDILCTKMIDALPTTGKE